VAFRDIQYVIELVQFLDHDHDFFADFRAREGELDKLFVFETVQDQQAIARLFQRQCGVKFGLRTCFESEIVPGTSRRYSSTTERCWFTFIG
jgi:hypothetical protein